MRTRTHTRHHPSDAEAIVLGGGAAGGAAALALARAGRRVLLIEREAAPREKVCGEFLGADAAALLARLGLDLGALGAVPLREACLAHGRRVAAVALPFAAWGLPRRVLDEALLRAAAEAGATVLRGRAAQAAVAPDPCRPDYSLADRGLALVEPAIHALGVSTQDDRGLTAGKGWAVRLADGTVLRSPHLVLATGKHEMRGLPRTTAGEGALGLKLHLRLRADPPEGVALLACRGGYAGLQPTAGGLANLCAALRVREADTAAVARDPAALLAHVAAGSDLAATLLAGAEPAQPRPLAVARIPYRFLHRDQPGGAPEGLWRIGDQFAVIPSFSGDGVAMALAGGLGAARAIASGDGASAAAFHAALRHRLAGPMRVAGLVALLLGHAPGALVAATARLPGAARQVARRTRLPGDLMA